MHARAIKIRFRLVVEPDDGGFHVYCPELKGLHACGETEEEALKHGEDAAEAYVRSLLKHDDPLPIGIVEHDQHFSSLTEMFKTILIHALGRKNRPHSHIKELSVAP